MKLNNLQVLRAIAAYMVLLAHIEDIEAKRGIGHILGRWTDIGDWGVDLFFVLSGFVMVLVSHHTLGGLRDAGKFLWSRVTRIYPLWWLCLSALVPIWLFRPQLVYGGTQQEISLLKDYLLIPKSESPLLQTGWTLIHEMYFYIFFAALLMIPLGERRRLPILILWGTVAVSLGLILNPSRGEEPVLRLLTHPMLLEFLAGAAAAFLWRSTRGALGVPALAVGAAALIIGMTLYVNGALGADSGGFITHDRARVILFLPSAALLTYGAASIELRQDWKLTGLPVSIGDWSYSLYLTHMLSANFFGLVWGKVAMPGLLDNAIALPAIMLGCTLVAWASFTLFEQPVTGQSKKLGQRIFGRLRPAAAQV
ncbi:putative acyltransferase [Hyphomonas polymorpha PS728]|uniref:Putative acyltransferase n=1 Tax=Hyphomonas polymorpha PS728 TaxID=1280954 RepID=A0A062VJG6_9PROT|nr:acyltransferase [Hyphomonas polymorpha]KCZ98221.1 putative acyltransferase [Hyphomonas polymorpha PS728]